MPQLRTTSNDENAETLHIVYDGGLALSGTLILKEYSNSLRGWQELFELLGEVYLRRFNELRNVPVSELLRIEIIAEDEGSFDAVLKFVFQAAVAGIIGSAANDRAVWSFRSLFELCKKAISGHVQKRAKPPM